MPVIRRTLLREVAAHELTERHVDGDAAFGRVAAALPAGEL